MSIDDEIISMIEMGKMSRQKERWKQSVNDIIRYMRSLPESDAQTSLQEMVQSGAMSLYLFAKILELVKNPEMKYEFVDAH